PFFDTITDTGEADSPLSGTYVASASALETDSSDDDDFEDVVGQDALFNVGDVEHLSESEFASDIASVASNCLGNDTDASSVDDDDFEDVVTGDTVFGVGDAELSAETGGVNDAVFAAAGSSPETTSSISDDDFGDVERFSEPEIADGIPFVAWDDFDSDLEITSINGDDLEDVAARDSTLETGSAEFSSEAGGANIAALVAAGSNDGIPETSSISSDDFDFDLEVTVADACTGKFVDQWRLGEDHTSRNAKISNLAFCPTNSNVLMASCGARVNQIRIMDLRDARKPVLSFGVDLFAEYPEEMTPAWNPDNGQVVVPYNHEQTGYDHDYLATFDTRYINANRDSIQALSPYAVGTRAISFGIDQYTNESIMVTADDIGNIGIAHCESTEEYRDEEDRRRGYSESVVNKYTTDSYIVEEWSSDRIHNNTHCRSDYSGEEYSYYDDWGEYD
ncbi:hypothetical protein LPJ53_005710, partial [Coemansia erecta]